MTDNEKDATQRYPTLVHLGFAWVMSIVGSSVRQSISSWPMYQDALMESWGHEVSSGVRRASLLRNILKLSQTSQEKTPES